MKRLALIVAVFLLLPAGAQAERWKRAGSIAATPLYGTLATTVDEDGNALFAVTTDHLSTRARPRGGPFQPTQLVTPGTADPVLAGNAAGEAVLAWSDSFQPLNGTQATAALREPGESFGAPEAVFDGASHRHLCDRVASAISDSGTAMVVFTVRVSGKQLCRLLASVRPAGADRFGEPVELDPSMAFHSRPQVAFDASGDALVVWAQRGSEYFYGLRNLAAIRYVPAAGGFQPAQSLAIPGEWVGGSGANVRLRISPTGAAILAWGSIRGRTTRIAAAVGDTRRGFAPPKVLSGRAAGASVDAGVGADGTRAVAWRGGGPGHARVHVARAAPGAETMTKRDSENISARRAAELALTVTDGGRVTVAWSRHLRKGRVPSEVEAATAGPSRPFGRAQALSHRGALHAFLQIVTDTRGNQFLSWLEAPKGETLLNDTTAHWAMAPAATGHFGHARQMLRTRDVRPVQLYRGALGAMLAVVGRPNAESGTDWSLLTYGER